MEASTTEIVVKMVEAGLGVSLVPLMPNGAVTRGARVSVRSLPSKIRPIHSGVLLRRRGNLDPPAEAFMQFLHPKPGRDKSRDPGA
jgi:DNA-binding transcriptional LysR family regulator